MRIQPWTILVPLALFCTLAIFTALAFTVNPIVSADPSLFAGNMVSPTTTNVVTSVTMSTSTLPPATTTTGGPVVTTTPIVFVPAQITCPPNISVSLGSMLETSETGIATVVSGNYTGCTSAGLTFTDAIEASTMSRRSRRHLEPAPRNVHFDQKRTGSGRMTLVSTRQGRMAGESSMVRIRTPSFPSGSNLETVEPFYQVDNTGVSLPKIASAVNANHVITGIDTPAGTVYTVLSSDQSAVLGTFNAAATLGIGECAGSSGSGQILWDHNAGRWLLVETQMNSTDYYLCLYISTTNDPLGMYTSMQVLMSAPLMPMAPRMGIWDSAYLLTLNSAGENCCVIDRNLLLTSTLFSGFCATPISGELAGFTVQQWAPASVEGNSPMPGPASQNANGAGVGALFFRHRDDELHNGASTPQFDTVDVEHWSQINFAAQTYIPVRYSINVNDFDSSFTMCEAEDSCIPRPNGNAPFDPNRARIMQSAAFRNRGVGRESIMLSFVSHANGVDTSRIRWLELSWQQPVITFAPRWVNIQEGELIDTNLHYWNPSIAMDEAGTIAIAYNFGNSSVGAGLAAAYRVQSDPVDEMRTSIVSFTDESITVTLSNSSDWGPYASLNSWPGGPRWFYVSAPYADEWKSVSYRLLVNGELVARTFRAQDACNTTECTQFIQLQ